MGRPRQARPPPGAVLLCGVERVGLATSSETCRAASTAFEKRQSATGNEETVAALATLSRIESRIRATPAEGLRGVVVKLGLDRFLHEHADAVSEQAESAYADLVRLTGHDPAAEILAKLRDSSHH